MACLVIYGSIYQWSIFFLESGSWEDVQWPWHHDRAGLTAQNPGELVRRGCDLHKERHIGSGDRKNSQGRGK